MGATQRRSSAATRTRKASSEEGPDEVLQAKLTSARRSLERRGVLSGIRSKRLSARVDPGLVEEAKRRSGLQSDSELVSAALALMAESDTFGIWLVAQKGTLSEDFELAF
jgi:hypothetical protein